ALLETRELGTGIADVTWKVPRDRPPGAAAVPRLPERCHALTTEETGVDGAGLATRWRVDCGAAPLAGERIGVAHPEMLPSGAVVRVVFPDGRVAEGVLARDPPGFHTPAAPRPWRVLLDYARLAIGH